MQNFNQLFVNFLPYFCVLSLISIGLIFSERAGILNLGINGVVVFGATVYMIFGHIISKDPQQAGSGWWQILLFILSGLGGLLFSLLHGFVCIKLKANQAISGIALNILSPAITIMILFIFGEANKLPFFIDELALGNAANYEVTNVVSLKVFVTFIIIIISFVMLTFTKWGLRLKSIGENPQAADVVGINVNKNKWVAVMIAGIIAGVAGAIFMTTPGKQTTFKGDVEGLGYLAIAIMIVGRWRVLWSVLVSTAFAILFGLAKSFNSIFPNEKDSIKYVVSMIPYLITIFILIFLSSPMINLYRKMFNLNQKATNTINWNGPKSIGEPYDKSKR